MHFLAPVLVEDFGGTLTAGPTRQVRTTKGKTNNTLDSAWGQPCRRDGGRRQRRGFPHFSSGDIDSKEEVHSNTQKHIKKRKNSEESPSSKKPCNVRTKAATSCGPSWGRCPNRTGGGQRLHEATDLIGRGVVWLTAPASRPNRNGHPCDESQQGNTRTPDHFSKLNQSGSSRLSQGQW